MTSEIRTNTLTSRAGLSTVTLTDSGPMFSGITTFVDNSGFTFGVGGGTSIFTPATNVLTFGTNNTEKVRIDANGNTNITGVTTAANFKTGVSNLHDVGLTLSGGQIDVGSNIKIGTAGVVTATSFVGDGSNLTGLSGVSIANQGNDRLITATGTTDALNAEANLTYNGNHLQFNTTANGHGVKLVSTGNYYNKLSMDSGATSAGAFLNVIDFSWDGDKVADIVAISGSDTTNKDDGHLVFRTSPSQGSIAERLRIHSGGIVTIGNDHSGAGTLGADLAVANVAGANIVVGDTVSGEYLKLKGTSGAAWVGSKSNHPLIFFTNGESNEHMRITHDTGAVGIGTNNPSYELEVHDGSGAAALRLKDGANNVICDLIAGSTGGHLRTTYNHPLKFSTNQVERMRINTDGTLFCSNNLASAVPNGQFGFRMDRGGGNGTSLHVENLNNDSVNNNAEVRLVTNHSNCRIVHHNQGGFYVIQSASGYLHYYQNGISRVYIDPNGRVGVNYTGTAGWAEKLNVRGDYGSGQYAIAVQITNSSGSLMRFGTSSGLCGSISGSGTGCSFNTSSDYRLKENDVNIIDGISRVKQLRPIRFNWKSDPSKIEDGFFAHEVSPVVPESVTGEKDAEIDEIGEGYQKIDHSKLIPLLTASIKELITKVETLEEENIALRARVTNLEGN